MPALLAAVLAAAPAMAQSAPAATGTRDAPAARPGNSPQTAGLPTEGQVDLNSASASELDGLPGIGKARAQAIIKNRPYKSPNDLVSRHIISEKVFDGFKDRVTTR
jgi:DNA uptake protein ComE-like DNA-binding protein